MALQRLVAPAPDAFLSAASVPLFVDNPGHPHPDVEAQAEEPSLKQHVPAEQRTAWPVDAAQDPGIGEFVLADQAARGLPDAAGLRRARRLLADHRGAGVHVPVALDGLGTVLRGPGRVVVDAQPGQLVEDGGLVEPAQ